MKTTLLILAGLFAGTAAYAGPIDSACIKSAGRSNGATCGCIQQIADTTLSRTDQRRAAGFFGNPDKAQEVRMSDRPSDTDFWNRYKTFVATAENYCAR